MPSRVRKRSRKPAVCSQHCVCAKISVRRASREWIKTVECDPGRVFRKRATWQLYSDGVPDGHVADDLTPLERACPAAASPRRVRSA